MITSVCQIEEVKTNNDFANVEDFLAYTNYYSIFDPEELKKWYQQKKCYVLKMTYNIALTKRVTNGYLVDELGLAPSYWGFFQLTDAQFDAILKKGEVDESVIINSMLLRLGNTSLENSKLKQFSATTLIEFGNRPMNSLELARISFACILPTRRMPLL